MSLVRSFKLTPRHAASLVAVIASLYFTGSQMNNDRLRAQRDLELSSGVLTQGLREAFEPAARDHKRLAELAESFQHKGRLAGVAVYDAKGGFVAVSPLIKERLTHVPGPVSEVLASKEEAQGYAKLGRSRLRVNAVRLRGAPSLTALAVFHETAYIENRLERSRWDSVRRMAIQAGVFLAAVYLFGLFLKDKPAS